MWWHVSMGSKHGNQPVFPGLPAPPSVGTIKEQTRSSSSSSLSLSDDMVTTAGEPGTSLPLIHTYTDIHNELNDALRHEPNVCVYLRLSLPEAPNCVLRCILCAAARRLEVRESLSHPDSQFWTETPHKDTTTHTHTHNRHKQSGYWNTEYRGAVGCIFPFSKGFLLYFQRETVDFHSLFFLPIQGFELN